MDQFKGSVDDRGCALPLPKFVVKGTVHVLNILAVAHHRKIAIFALYC